MSAAIGCPGSGGSQSPPPTSYSGQGHPSADQGPKAVNPRTPSAVGHPPLRAARRGASPPPMRQFPSSRTAFPSAAPPPLTPPLQASARSPPPETKRHQNAAADPLPRAAQPHPQPSPTGPLWGTADRRGEGRREGSVPAARPVPAPRPSAPPAPGAPHRAAATGGCRKWQ